MFRTLYYKVTHPNGEVSYYSGVQTLATPERTLEQIRRNAAKRGIASTYELSDYFTYAAHYAAMRATTTTTAKS